VIAVAVAMRSGCPARHPSPKNRRSPRWRRPLLFRGRIFRWSFVVPPRISQGALNTPFLRWNLSRTAHPGSAGVVSSFDQSVGVAAGSLISIGDHDVKSTGELFDVLLESLADVLRTAASATPSFARSSGPSASSRRPSWLPSRVRPVLLVENDPTEASRSEGSLEPAGRSMDR
jgi:hypothetical protein